MTKTSQFGKYTLCDYGIDEIGSLEQIWRPLEKGGDMTAFQSYDWYKNLCTLHRKERTKNLFRKFRFVVVSRENVPVLLAPFEIHTFGIGYRNYGAPRGVYFMGRLGYTDYLNFIYDTFDCQALEIILDYVSKTYRQKRFYLDRMLEKSASFVYLTERFQGVRMKQDFSALVLPETFEEYRLSLSKSTRQNIRTAINRANKNGLSLTHCLIPDEEAAVKEQIIALNTQRLDKKNKASRQQMSLPGRIYCFFAEIYRALFSAKPDIVHDSKNTFAFLVKDGDTLVSFFWGIRNDYLKEYYVILAGVHQDYEWYSPNISHLYLFLEEQYQAPVQDIRVLDFTRGGEGYKKKIGCTERPVSGFYWTKNN